MSRRTIATFAGLVISLATAQPAAADPVKLVTGNGFQPHTDENLDNGGMFTEIVRRIYQSMGHEVSVDFTGWNRGQKKVLEDEYLAHFPLMKTEQRLAKFYYSEAVTAYDQRPMVMAGDTGQFTSKDDLVGTRTCLPSGWSAGATVDSMVETGKIDMTRAKLPTCYRMLEAGRIDYVTMAPPTARWTAKAALGSIEAVEADALRLEPVKLHVVFDKDEAGAEARNAFNKALEAFRAEGKVRAIEEEWLN